MNILPNNIIEITTISHDKNNENNEFKPTTYKLNINDIIEMFSALTVNEQINSKYIVIKTYKNNKTQLYKTLLISNSDYQQLLNLRPQIYSPKLYSPKSSVLPVSLIPISV